MCLSSGTRPGCAKRCTPCCGSAAGRWPSRTAQVRAVSEAGMRGPAQRRKPWMPRVLGLASSCPPDLLHSWLHHADSPGPEKLEKAQGGWIGTLVGPGSAALPACTSCCRACRCRVPLWRDPCLIRWPAARLPASADPRPQPTTRGIPPHLALPGVRALPRQRRPGEGSGPLRRRSTVCKPDAWLVVLLARRCSKPVFPSIRSHPSHTVRGLPRRC